VLLKNIKVSADRNSTGTCTVTKRMSVRANQNKQARTIAVITLDNNQTITFITEWLSGHRYPLTSFAPETPDDNHVGGMHSTSWKKEIQDAFTSFLFEILFRPGPDIRRAESDRKIALFQGTAQPRRCLFLQRTKGDLYAALTALPTSLKAKRPTGQGTNPIFFKASDKVARVHLSCWLWSCNIPAFNISDGGFRSA
jgi:hypothetical protein